MRSPTATTRESLSISEDSGQPKISKSLLNHIHEDPLKKSYNVQFYFQSREISFMFVGHFYFVIYFLSILGTIDVFFLLAFFQYQKHWSFFKFLSISLISPLPHFIFFRHFAVFWGRCSFHFYVVELFSGITSGYFDASENSSGLKVDVEQIFFFLTWMCSVFHTLWLETSWHWNHLGWLLK